jgi:DNA-binding CsgD family transcriptional regulator
MTKAHSQFNRLNPEIWNVFTTDPATGVTLVSIDGEILYINEQSTRVFFDEPKDPDTIVGKSMYDIGFPQEWAKERIDLFHKMHESNESLLLRTIWHGKQQYSWMSPISGEPPEFNKRVLVITRRIPATEEANYLIEGEHEVVNSNIIRLGELESLTARELEVLALIGQGMSMKEIAAALFRSVKTMENHRESIGRKLKLTRRNQLACLAHVAGLRLEDSERIRVSDPKE